MNITPVVKQLLIINIIFFVGSMLVPGANEILALHNAQSDLFRFWQILTHMFMHGNIMHIFFNMFALLSFGSSLEHFWGGKKFLFFYISCGLGAAALQLGINYLEVQQLLAELADLNLSEETIYQIINAPGSDGMYFRGEIFANNVNPILARVQDLPNLTEEQSLAMYHAAATNQGTMVGASGAIYGLLVAFAFMFPNAELMLLFIPVPIKAKYFVPGLLVIDLFLGFKGNSIFGSGGTGVAHFAHIGGAIIGFIMMWYWRKNQFDRNRWN